MNTLIYFRDLGCQGATEILQNAKELAKTENDALIKENVKDISLFLLSRASDFDTLALASPLKIWKEIADTAGIKIKLSDKVEEISPQDFVIVEKECMPLFLEKDLENNCIEEEHLYDYTMKNAMSTFSSFLYTALRLNKDYNEISIAYMGDVGAQNIKTTNNLLNAGICMKNILSFAFSEYSARQEETGFEQTTLDFAMSAGAKIFLTYAPEFIDESCDILYLANWTYQTSKELKPMKHPFCYEQVGNFFLDKTQIVSFIDEVSSSEINLDLYKKAAITSRIATLKYMLNI